jgi:hypothetical protein
MANPGRRVAPPHPPTNTRGKAENAAQGLSEGAIKAYNPTVRSPPAAHLEKFFAI